MKSSDNAYQVMLWIALGSAVVIAVAFVFMLLLSGCCQRDILGDCIHRSPGSTNNLSVQDLDTLCNGTDAQAQQVIERNK